MTDISVADQEAPAIEFLSGLLDAFDYDADIDATTDEEAVEIAVTSDNELGLLVGQRGSTLDAIQELTRRAVAQSCNGRLDGRLRVDVAGYRARRAEALTRFAEKVSAQVLESGKPAKMDPMSPPDRKVVHDAVNEIDGVHTVSEGEDRRRHIVIRPGD